MIIGIGTDICDIRRIKKVLDKHGDRFLNKVFTSYEQSYSLQKGQLENRLAKFFAAKEAFVKAIGNTTGISWQDIEVRHHSTGQPYLQLKGQALISLKDLLNHDKDEEMRLPNVHLSLSDDSPYALAFVIISKG